MKIICLVCCTRSVLQEQAVEAIRQECSQAAGPLLRVAEAGVKAVHRFHFNIGGMRECLSEDIRTSAEHRGDFERLAAVRGPVVYVFEICPPSSPGAVLAAAIEAGRPARILHRLTQPADHPVSLFHPEGAYLKGLVLAVE